MRRNGSGVGNKCWSVHTILRNHLKMRKVSARWVPHRLTSDQAERRLEVTTHLLSRFDSEGQDFLSSIVAIDVTWVSSYESELILRKYHLGSDGVLVIISIFLLCNSLLVL